MSLQIIIRLHAPENLYRTTHPYWAIHDNLFWPRRTDMTGSFPVAPNDGSFDVYSRLFTLANASSDGGAIKVTGQQWAAIRKRDGFVLSKEKWMVGGTDRIMMWASDYPYPVFHYPLCFGGNIVNVVKFYGLFAQIETWPKDVDVPEDLPPWFWHRCWSVYKSDQEIDKIRDAPAGIGGVALRTDMLLLAHSNKAWIHAQGLIKL